MKPILCNYYVTLRCNSKCEFCNIWQGDKNIESIDINQVKNNLKDLKKLGVKFIDFTGGEPLLYRDLPEVLQFAKELGFYTTVTTNCLLYSKYAEQINPWVDYLQFSLLSADKETHNQFAGVKSYEKVVESIAITKKLKKKVSLNFTLTDENYSEIENVIAFAQKHKCMLNINPCFSYFGNKGVSAETIRKADQFFGKPYVVIDLANHQLIKNGGNKVSSPVCRAVSSTFVISPNNYLMLPCYHHFTKKLKINDNLFELYNSDKVMKFKKMEGKFDFCEACTIYCYMRTSFYRNIFKKYFWLYALTGINYLRQSVRSID